MSNSSLSNWKPNGNTLSAFLSINSIGIICASIISQVSGNSSRIRVVFFIVSIIIGIIFCAIAIKIRMRKAGSFSWFFHDRPKLEFVLMVSTFLIFIIFWSLIWTPLDRFGGFYYYIQAAFPYLIWITLASLGALGLQLANRYGFDFQRLLKFFGKQKSIFLLMGGLFLLFLTISWIASIRVVGVKPIEEDFWYGAGVPILAFQVYGALVVGFILSILINKQNIRLLNNNYVVDIFVFVLIWVISAFLWAKEPVKPDFLVTSPVAPNFEMYPDYDARNYDVMSQFAVIGQGINNHSFFDRVLYPAFLVYLHTFVGQNYSRVMAYQSTIFAILPGLLYFLARFIYNRSSGIVLGLLAALRGINQINLGSIIETAHQKQMLTEYPTAVSLVLTTLLLILWLKYPRSKWWLVGISGGVVGISTLLRPHTLILIPVFITIAFFVYRHQAKIWLFTSTLFIVSALLAVIPWAQFSGQNISIFDLYFTRIRDVIQQRYTINPDHIANYSGLNPNLTKPTPIRALYHQSVKSEKGILAFATDNFLNNLVTTVEILPTTPFNLEPRTVVKKTETFWKPYWDGKLSNWAKVMILLNLLIVSLGLAAAYKRARLGGITPLIIMLAYYFINSLGRTSGGRYIVPADWVILLYYVIGLVSVFNLAKTLYISPQIPLEPNIKDTFNISKWFPGLLIGVLLFSFAMGSLIPISQQLNPIRFPNQSEIVQSSLLSSISNNNTVYSKTNLEKFLSTNGAVILTGRSLYPRQFNINEGLDISVYEYYHNMPFPRTLLTVIGQNGETVIVLPTSTPALIANASDVMVVGCKVKGYVIARAVIRLTDNKIFESLNRKDPLVCPMVLPVCDNNKSCH